MILAKHQSIVRKMSSSKVINNWTCSERNSCKAIYNCSLWTQTGPYTHYSDLGQRSGGLYHIILTNQNKLFLRDIHIKSWYGHTGVLDDLILSGFRCAFSGMVQYSLCHFMDIGTCDSVHWSAAPHHRIAYRIGFWMCVVLVLNVISCSCHHFLDRNIFHHD